MKVNPLIHKLRTPIETLNISSCGGLELGTLIEAWGNPYSGKSTFCYQCAEYFLEDYNDNAELLILDSEKSANLLRLKYVFKITPGVRIDLDGKEEKIEGGDKRVVLAPAITIEDGAMIVKRKMKECSEKGKILLVIWDSITTSRPKREHEELEKALSDPGFEVNNWSGGMMLRPRVLATEITDILGLLWSSNAVVMLINQVRTSIGKFVTMEALPGGYAFKHGMHYSIYFDYQKKMIPSPDQPYLKKGTLSQVSANKNKFSPAIQNVPIFIYDDIGGKINSNEEIIMVALTMKLIVQSGSWYSFPKEVINDTNKELGKSFRLSDLFANPAAVALSKEMIKKSYMDNFYLVRCAYQEREAANVTS